MRFWDVEKGLITLSDEDIKGINTDSLRENESYVTQETKLFHDSIERQRLGIARAFLHDAPLVLLDEPTSNLDSLNEAVILKSIRDYGRDKNKAVVS